MANLVSRISSGCAFGRLARRNVAGPNSGAKPSPASLTFRGEWIAHEAVRMNRIAPRDRKPSGMMNPSLQLPPRSAVRLRPSDFRNR